MKIAYLITRSDTVGGAHIHVLDIATAATAEGHDVHVLVGGDGPYSTLLRERGIKVTNLRYLVRPIRPHIDALAVIECWQALRRLEPDILHTHSTKAGLVGRVAARAAGIPSVFTAHGWAFSEGIGAKARRLALLLERLAARLGDAIICVSEYDRELALELNVGNRELLTRIRNGVTDIGVKLRSDCVHDDIIKIVSVARLDVQKDHELLIHALESLRDYPWKLELIGDGPLMEAIRAKVMTLRLEDRVAFSGLCRDVPLRLASSDIFVLVSNWEGLPLSILEAMRAQLPVVASNVGGVSESVVDGETGYLVPRGDKTLLAERLRRLLQDASLRIQMGKAGRATYEHEFSFDVMYRRTWEVYRRVLARKATL